MDNDFHDALVDAAARGRYDEVLEAIEAALPLLDRFTVKDLVDRLNNEVEIRSQLPTEQLRDGDAELQQLPPSVADPPQQ